MFPLLERYEREMGEERAISTKDISFSASSNEILACC